MQDFFEIAKMDFVDTFGETWIFPLLLASAVWILWKEKDRGKKILFGGLPLVFLMLYWCPLTGIPFMKLLGENVYWRILWLILPAVTIPYGGCLLLLKLHGFWRQGVFLACLSAIALAGNYILSTEWFLPSPNAYKIPQNVVQVCDLLPGNIHALVSNRLLPYIRQYDPTITLAYARNALVYGGEDDRGLPERIMYLEAQKPEIDVDVLGPLVREEGCTFLVFSNNHTYIGDWEDYGYQEYAATEEFVIFQDIDYEEGQDTRKWEE